MSHHNLARRHVLDVFPMQDDGIFPGNTRCPVILMRAAFDFKGTSGVDERARVIETTFERNGWTNGWRDGIYGFHHYHSTAHEALGCCRGDVCVQLGGPSGPKVELSTGDVLVLPAGASHCRIGASPELCIVGSYAHGRDYDMNRGHEGERPQADRNIEGVPLPAADPALGADGPLRQHWS